jgi:hypothetical protein
MVNDYVLPDVASPREIAPGERQLNLISISDDARREPPSPTRDELISRFGVQARPREDGNVEYYFRAGGVEQSVAYQPDTAAGRSQANKELEELAAGKMRLLERGYKVTFAPPGQDAGRVIVVAPNCTESAGDVMKALPPTLPALFAIEHALEHSQPSQLGEDGKKGIKIYMLDKQPFPPMTEGRPALGFFKPHDDDGQRALFVTPEGAALPPTPADGTDHLGRSLSMVLTHELAHNGQENLWGPARILTFIALAGEVGWKLAPTKLETNWILEGKDGQQFAHVELDCKTPPAWYRTNAIHTKLVQPDGTPVKKNEEAKAIPGAELRDRLSVKPATHYFTAPLEEFAESITTYRSNAESRARLMRESPKLYELTRRIDNEEIDRAYGTDWLGRSRFVRMPEGLLAANTLSNATTVWRFEAENEVKRRYSLASGSLGSGFNAATNAR